MGSDPIAQGGVGGHQNDATGSENDNEQVEHWEAFQGSEARTRRLPRKGAMARGARIIRSA